jgi:uncharacterized OsmC-like protein
MTREEIRTKIDGAIEYLSKNPAEASYTDSFATARLADTGGLKVTVEGPDGVSITSDMPSSVGGGGSAPGAGWYLRAAEASCVATLIAMRAAHQGVELDSVEVTVDSESDDRGILGIDDSVPAGPLSSRVVARVKAKSATELEIAEIVRWAVKHCPVCDALERSVPVSLEIEA